MNETNFTDYELQLIHAALMNYGDKLAEMKKSIPNEPSIGDMLADKAKDSWTLARKIKEYM